MSFGKDFFFDRHPMFLVDYQTLDIIDVNSVAADFYGYSREELRVMNIAELGTRVGGKKLNPDEAEQEGDSIDEIWKHSRKDESEVYVQFTYHDFNHAGKPVKLAVAHNITGLWGKQGNGTTQLPKIEAPISNEPLAFIEWDKDLKVKRWSKKAEELFGWREEEVLSDPDFFAKFVHEDELDTALKNISRLKRENKTSYQLEGRNYTKDGRILDCEWYNSILVNENNELSSIYALVQDISERKQSEQLFRVLSEKSLVGVYLIQDGVFKYINPRFAKIFHYPKEEVEGKLGPADLVHPEDREMVLHNIDQRLSGKRKSIEYDFRGVTRHDNTIHVNVYGTRINYRGKPAVMGTLVDITANNLALERYRSSVKSFEALFDSISDAIYIQKPDGRFIEVNQGAMEMYGYEREEFIGNTPEFLAAPGKVDMEKTKRHHELALKGKPQSFRWWGKRKNGEVFPKDVLLNSGTYFGEEVVIAIARDISESYETEQQVKKNEELFRQLFQNAHIGIAMLDQNEEIHIVNSAFEDIFGYATDELKGLDINKVIVPEEEMEEARKLSEIAYKGRSADLTAKRKTKSGELIDVMIYGVPVAVDGKIIAIFGIYVDITDRIEAQEQVRRSLKEKEVLLAEIHHRVKNNLAVITGLLELQADNTADREAREILRESQLRINSIALIHEKLYQSEDLSQISFDVYLRELVKVILKSITSTDKNIDVSVDADEIFLTINEAIPCGLILNELLTNSFKHAFKSCSRGRVCVAFKKKGDASYCLRVEDDGCGMPEDLVLEHSQSLGLTLIKTLTRQLQGEGRFLEVKEGSCFELKFGND